MSDKSLFQALDKLAKWRKFFANWQLGTAPANSGRYRALADHREVTIVMRAELSAMAGLLIRKGVLTSEEWDAALEREAARLDASYAERFPGWSSAPDGLHMKLPEAIDTMQTLGFPP